MYTKDIGGNVPLFGQKKGFYCGEACAEMARDGYPNPSDRLFYQQDYLKKIIKAHCSAVDKGWSTDPQGLQQSLQTLSIAAVDWVQYANKQRDAVMFFILNTMDRTGFPVPVLVNHGHHWVLVVGWQTDKKPTAGDASVLDSIRIYDPEPLKVGTDTTMSASEWFNSAWFDTVNIPGTWMQDFVAVGQGPLAEADVKIMASQSSERELVRGDNPDQAHEWARRCIDELKLTDRPQCSILKNPTVVPLPPLRVRDDSSQPVSYYAIVPFGVRHDFTDDGNPLVRLSMLMNAQTGVFQGVTTFGKPIRYLPQESAIAIVAAGLREPPTELHDAKAQLIFQPSEISHVRAYPFWEVIFDDKTYYVSQQGELFRELSPGPPGG